MIRARADIWLLALALGCAGASWLPARAHAAPPSEEPPAKERTLAAAEFERGRRAFERGDYREAAMSYESAFRLAPHGIAAFNAALSWQKLGGEDPREADALAHALETQGLPDKERAVAEQRLVELDARLGRMSIDAPAGARISVRHLRDVTPPVVVHAPPGAEQVSVQLRGGTTVERTLEVRAGETTRLDRSAFVEERSTAAARVAPSADNPAMRAAGWTGVALAGALGAAAIGLGVATLDARDEFDADGQRSPDLRDRAVALRTATNVAWFSAAGFAVIGSVLLIVDATQQERSEVAISLSPTGGALRIRH